MTVVAGIIVATAIIVCTHLAFREWRRIESHREAVLVSAQRKDQDHISELFAGLQAVFAEGNLMHAQAHDEARASYEMMNALGSELAERLHRSECEQYDLAVRLQNATKKSVRMP